MVSFVVFLNGESEQGWLVVVRVGVGLDADSILPQLGLGIANVDANPIAIGAVAQGHERIHCDKDNITLARRSERGHPAGGLSLDI